MGRVECSLGSMSCASLRRISGSSSRGMSLLSVTGAPLKRRKGWLPHLWRSYEPTLLFLRLEGSHPVAVSSVRSTTTRTGTGGAAAVTSPATAVHRPAPRRYSASYPTVTRTVLTPVARNTWLVGVTVSSSRPSACQDDPPVVVVLAPPSP